MTETQRLIFNIILFGVYFPILTAIALIIIYKIKLLACYMYYKGNRPKPVKEFDHLPFVTLQLPIFNEINVVERLIGSAVAVDYPRDRFEIQVLDDSTDETVQLSQQLVQQYQSQGFNISMHHRTDRKDFKAGALAEGLKTARGEFVAIFDSDFIIPKNFLNETVHFFTEPKTGMVQCRWGFINEKESLLTRLQTTFLNGHFIIEHTSRNRSGHFFNFNGTAGIWRKRAIFESGGWEGDTLTEDLDLSYRAQLKGWKFVYLKDLVAPSELPPTLDAFYGQQFRWVKGMFQVFLKILPAIWRSRASTLNKFDATCHLTSFAGYIFSVLISIFTIPVLLITKEYIDLRFMYIAVSFIFINCFMIWVYYFFAEVEARGLKFSCLIYPFLLVIFSVGYSLNGVYAIKEAALKKKSPFIRTPKFNNNLRKKFKSQNNARPVYKAAAFFNIYFISLTAYILIQGKFNLLPALLFFSPSYFWLFYRGIREKFLFKTFSQ
jgi:cellulose synthase/poly-beta-1,6-N-acetylglucosamine synthase-like glycosyltransferase